jgi:hypothetical protein
MKKLLTFLTMCMMTQSNLMATLHNEDKLIQCKGADEVEKIVSEMVAFENDVGGDTVLGSVLIGEIIGAIVGAAFTHDPANPENSLGALLLGGILGVITGGALGALQAVVHLDTFMLNLHNIVNKIVDPVAKEHALAILSTERFQPILEKVFR